MSSKQGAHRALKDSHSDILKNIRMANKDSKSDGKKTKNARQLERHLKGVANHHRIDILFLIERREGVTLDEIVTTLKGNTKTISEHTRRLVQAGLVEKRYRKNWVTHSLSPYGKKFCKFLKAF